MQNQKKRMAETSENGTKKMKMYYPNFPEYDAQDYDVYIGTNYQGQKMAMLSTSYSRRKNYENAIIRSPVLNVRYSNLGPNGNIGTCNNNITEESAKFTADVNANIPQYYLDLVPDAKVKADAFVTFLKEKTDEMLQMAWDENIMEGWKDKAMKKAKKEVKKNGGDVETVALDIFKQDATMSIFREDQDGEPIFNFRTKYRTKSGKLNRPTMWKRDKPGNMIDITDNVPWVAKDSLIQIDFFLHMYCLPTKYGIKGKMAPSITVVKLNNSVNKEKKQESVRTDIPFFED